MPSDVKPPSKEDAMGSDLSLSFGALSPALGKQLREQGLTPHRGQLVDEWQRYADAITTLAIQQLIVDGETTRARHRLLKRIAKVVRHAR